MVNEDQASLKAFISYSWTDENHTNKVLQLAQDLSRDGIHVVLDKWDLKEGQDANAYMERMVRDSEISKVIIISNKSYAEKSSLRKGGVGTETQIITPEIYSDVNQTKFVVCVFEKDEDGNPHLPIYYKSRIYIDLADSVKYNAEYEKLVRWLFNKPLLARPEIGKRPAFLNDGDLAQTSTGAKYRRAIEAIRDIKPHAEYSLYDFFEEVFAQTQKLRLGTEDLNAENYDDKIVQSVEKFLTLRNEIIEVIILYAQRFDVEPSYHTIHRFLERMLGFNFKPRELNSWNLTQFDNFRFINYELFLHILSIYLKLEKFNGAKFLIENSFYVENSENIDPMHDFSYFNGEMSSFEERKRRLNSNRISLIADTLKERCGTDLSKFRGIMQADFVLFLRSNSGHSGPWRPETLVYSTWARPETMPIFARSSSTSYFAKVLPLLGMESKNRFDECIEYIYAKKRMPRWDYRDLNVKVLANHENLCTRP